MVKTVVPTVTKLTIKKRFVAKAGEIMPNYHVNLKSFHFTLKEVAFNFFQII